MGFNHYLLLKLCVFMYKFYLLFILKFLLSKDENVKSEQKYHY